MDNKSTIIFVGRSGSGKGTQLELLQDYLLRKDVHLSIKPIIMGEIFRSFFKQEGYIQDIARDVSMKQGKFQPDFLTNALLVKQTIDIMDENSVVFFDGYPRTLNQLSLLKDLLIYIKRDNPIILNIEVSRDSVKKRMFARGRGDDNETAIESRLNEYDDNILPMLEAIKADSHFKYFEIEGEASKEEIHLNIIKTLNL